MARGSVTRKDLSQSIKKLMRSTPYEKISVEMITDGCSLNRKSFYYHFQNKDELVNWILDNEFREYLESTPEEEQGWDVVAMLCKYLYSERDLYRAILTSSSTSHVKDHFRLVMEPVLMKYLRDIFNVERSKTDFLVFASDTFLAAIERWLSSEEMQNPSDFLFAFRSRLIMLSERSLLNFR